MKMMRTAFRESSSSGRDTSLVAVESTRRRWKIVESRIQEKQKKKKAAAVGDRPLWEQINDHLSSLLIKFMTNAYCKPIGLSTRTRGKYRTEWMWEHSYIFNQRSTHLNYKQFIKRSVDLLINIHTTQGKQTSE